jgi:hypothetical protein
VPTSAARDAERALVHGVHEGARSVGVVAEVGLGGQRRLAGTQRVLEPAPGREELVAVADRVAHERGAPLDQEGRRDRRVREPAGVVDEQAEADAGAQEEAGAARIEAQAAATSSADRAPSARKSNTPMRLAVSSVWLSQYAVLRRTSADGSGRARRRCGALIAGPARCARDRRCATARRLMRRRAGCDRGRTPAACRRSDGT